MMVCLGERRYCMKWTKLKAAGWAAIVYAG